MLAMKETPVRTTYRVDVLTTIGKYAEYTSKRGVGRPMANSLASGLKMNKTGGRIVELPSGVVVDEWDANGNTVTAS